MIDALKHQWQLLRQDKPGERFVNLYERRQQAGKRGVSGVAMIVAAVLLMLVGLALMVLPGPGIPFLVVGVALLACESRGMAGIADRVELKLRALVQRFRGGRSS